MSTISAGNTISTGLNWASDTSGNLVLQSNGVSTVTLANAAIIMADATQFNTVNSFGMRNRLINGDMRIDQRNTGAAQTITAGAALAYTVDRWYAYSTGANVSGQRVANTALRFAYQFTGAASVTAIGFAQRIETANSYDLNGTTVTLSAYLANSLLSTVTWTAYYANTADTFGTLASPTRTQIATGTFTVSSTLTRYATNIVIPSAATTGIEIVFTVGAQTSGTWTIGGVQLEPGTVATPVDRRPVGSELVLCQRYAWRPTIGTDIHNFLSTAGAFASATSGFFSGNHPVTMRATPTLVTDTATLSNYAAYAANGGTYSAVTTMVLNPVSNAYMYLLQFAIASGGTAGQVCYLAQNGQTTLGLYYTAEL
jgi:hypothetical protein